MQSTAGAPDAQFVTLGIDREVFAVPVETVQEILDHREPFRLPDTPPYLLGLIDVRGQRVPVIDLRVKLGLPPVPATTQSRIIVLAIAFAGRQLVLGLLADRVFEVATLQRQSITPPPDIGTRWRCEYIDGIGHHGENFVIVLDLARLFSSETTAYLGTSAQASPAEARGVEAA